VSRLERAAAQIGSDVEITVLGDNENLTRRTPAASRIERDIPEDGFRKRLARADLLFLGLSFHTSHPEIIRTAAPARFPEYLAAGVPIVVHAPAGSHIVRRARALDVAQVVDRPSDEALADAIRGVLSDPKTAAARVARARECALEYDHRLVVDQLVETLVCLSNPAVLDVSSAHARIGSR
jgi:glycosyltransferase involved in cell wall biosynthesis